MIYINLKNYFLSSFLFFCSSVRKLDGSILSSCLKTLNKIKISVPPGKILRDVRPNTLNTSTACCFIIFFSSDVNLLLLPSSSNNSPLDSFSTKSKASLVSRPSV